jgi:hypothetical protein
LGLLFELLFELFIVISLKEILKVFYSHIVSFISESFHDW